VPCIFPGIHSKFLAISIELAELNRIGRLYLPMDALLTIKWITLVMQARS